MSRQSHDRPISIAMLALGGQGGGVLTRWLVDTAEANGFVAQSTYVAGVAQRTGATVYCVEMFSRQIADAAGQEPVFTPYPIPGDVDLVIAGELAETGRAIEKGFVTPNITTLIASSHRIYSMPEKEALGDGIMDLSKVIEVAGRAARQFVCFDMQQAADDTGSVISAVLLGAIAASGALPFTREAFEATIRQTGKAVEANLRGFAAGMKGGDSRPTHADSPPPADEALIEGPNGEALSARIQGEFPDAVRELALHGALRTLDYQDVRYAGEYLDSLAGIVEVDQESKGYALANEVARQLALQMSYEDTIRVAELKTRKDRFDRIRRQVGAADDQPVKVVEYFHPRLEEVCDTLPAFLGKAILDSGFAVKLLSSLFSKGRNLSTTGVSGFLVLHFLARLKVLRRGTYRFRKQQAFIRRWLEELNANAQADYDRAVAIARCMEIVRGYGSTYERGLARYLAIVDSASSAADVMRLHQAAMADEQGLAFQAALATEGSA